jgi:hypothetical protein
MCIVSAAEERFEPSRDEKPAIDASEPKNAGHITLDNSRFSATSSVSAAGVLQMTLMEDVAVLEDGSSSMALLIDVCPSRLAEAYRRSLGAPFDIAVDEEIPIPENITLSPDTEADGRATHIIIPVREGFYESIERLQEVSLGIITKISDSSMVPRSRNNACKVSMNAKGLLPIFETSQASSSSEWEIDVGPPSTKAIVGSVFTSMQMAQMMLKSMPGEQLYECFWSTKINLPVGATLLNTQEISSLEWKISFGGGTYMIAWVTVEGISTLVLREKTVVTEHAITAAPHCLCDTFSRYKTFKIRYQLPRPAATSFEEYRDLAELDTESGDPWSYTWAISWSDTTSASFTYGPLSAELTATATLTLSGYVGWDFDLFQGLTRFESWMSMVASIEVDFEATASASYSRTWEQTFFDWKTTYTFMVGVVPVWADLQITATGAISVNAYGRISLTASATASASFKAGVRWTNDLGWNDIFEVSTDADHTGPTLEATAGLCVRPSVRFQIAFLFYGVAGPFVEFEAYALATVTCAYPPPHGEWEITVNLQVTAGATFAGWLKDLLGLDDWSILLYDVQLMRWSGSWGSSTITITETLNPSTSPPEGSVLVYGTASFNDGSAVSFADVIVTVAGSSWTTTTDGTGGYSQFISAPSGEGQHTVQVRVTTGSLTATNSKTLTVSRGSPSGGRYTLSRTTTCKDVQSSSPYDPIEETTVFRRTDARAIIWLHFTDVYLYGSTTPLIRVKWEFYGPAGSLYSITEQTISDPGEGYYWIWYNSWGWIWISGYQAADMEGRWHCKVYIDEGSGYQFRLLEEFVIGYEVTDRTMTKDVQTSDPFEPIGRTDAFPNTDPKSWGWIRLDEVAESLEIKWEWFEPSTNKYSEFFWTTENPSGYWDWYKAWCWIAINEYPPQSKLGLWQVKAYIKDVYGNWDLEYSQYFTISDNTPPGAPGTPSGGGDYTLNGIVTWAWSPASEDGTIAKYQIQVGTTPGGNDVFDGYTNSLNMTIHDLASGHTYYARVRAMNTVGQWGPWSPNSNGITVDRPPVTIITDGPSETIDYADVVFTWKGSDDLTPTSNLVYSYCLQGKDTGWSPWQSTTSKEYDNLPDGNYEFLVKAKDQRGSEDPTPANRSFVVSVTCVVHLESEEDTKASGNLGTIEFEGKNYTLPTDIRTNRTMSESSLDIVSLPAGSRRTDPADLSLDESKLLNSISLNNNGQTVTVEAGETVSVTLTYQLWSPNNPTELDQLFFIYSWTSSWPPTSEYYYGIFHGMPSFYPGISGSSSFTFTAPSNPGTYYLYWCSSAHYSIPQGVSTYNQALSPPGHAKIVVRSTSRQYVAKYYPVDDCLFDHWGTTNGISVSDATINPTMVSVNTPGGALKAVYRRVHCTVRVESRRDTGESSDLGTVTFDDLNYTLPSGISKQPGTYQAYYTSASSYIFDHWETSGGASVSGAYVNPTSVTVSGDGTVRAVYRVFYEDGFESGRFNGWSGTSRSPGEIATVVSTFAHHGAYSSKFTSNGTGGSEYSYCYKTISSSTELYVRGYFYVSQSGIVDESDRFYFIILAGSDNVAYAGWRKVGGLVKWCLVIRNGTSNVFSYSASSPALNQWYCVELHWKEDSANGLGELYINGAKVCSIMGRNTASYGNVTKVRLGLPAIYYCSGTIVYGDCAKIASTYIGPEFLLEDSFESVNFGAWSGKRVSAGETATATNTRSYRGLYSAMFASNGTGGSEYSYCYKTISSSTELYVRGYFYVSQSGIADENDRFYFIILTGSSDFAYVGWRKVGGIVKWCLVIKNGSNNVFNYSSGSPSLGQWYCIELHWKKDAANGLGELRVDGALICSILGKNTSAYGDVIRVSFGLAALYYCGPTTVFGDYCIISRTDIATASATSSSSFLIANECKRTVAHTEESSFFF